MTRILKCFLILILATSLVICEVAAYEVQCRPPNL